MAESVLTGCPTCTGCTNSAVDEAAPELGTALTLGGGGMVLMAKSCRACGHEVSRTLNCSDDGTVPHQPRGGVGTATPRRGRGPRRAVTFFPERRGRIRMAIGGGAGPSARASGDDGHRPAAGLDQADGD